jgi:hypothetical protein
MLKTLLAALLLLSAPGAALAQAAPPTDWRIVSVEGTESAAYAPSTVRKTGQMAAFVILWRWRDPLSPGAAPDSILARRCDMRLVQLNCATGQIRNGGIRYYGADLKLMTARTGQDEWGPMDRTFRCSPRSAATSPSPESPSRHARRSSSWS